MEDKFINLLRFVMGMVHLEANGKVKSHSAWVPSLLCIFWITTLFISLVVKGLSLLYVSFMLSAPRCEKDVGNSCGQLSAQIHWGGLPRRKGKCYRKNNSILPKYLTLITGLLPIKIKRERSNLYKKSLLTIIYHQEMFGSGHNLGVLLDVFPPSSPHPTITKSYPFYT